MYKLHFHLDNHTTHEITASYKLNFKCLAQIFAGHYPSQQTNNSSYLHA